MSNRAELVRRLIAYRAASKVIEDALKEEGALEHAENETVSTHRLAVGIVAGSQAKDRVEVTDQDAFMAWLAGRYPTEVKTVTVQVVRNPEWLIKAREAWATFARDYYDGTPPTLRANPFPVVDPEGSIIPGVVFAPGGAYITTSVTPNMQARKRAIRAARLGVTMGVWHELELAITDPTYLTRKDETEEEDVVVTLAGVPVETVDGL